MAIGFGQSGEMAIVLKVKDDGSVVVEKFGDNADDAFKKTGDGADKAGKKWQQFSKDAKKYAAISSAAVAVLAGAAIKVGAGFEQAILNVASVAGANEAELKRLSAGAREQAKVSIFSATQAAEAQYALASAGFETNQILAAQANVMTLAAATQSDLATTSAITTSTLSQFNLSAEESGRVANVFAASISGSQATLQKLGDAMRFVGPVANALDIDLESTTAAISLLFNAGFKGEQAGTILRSSLISLQKPSGEAAKLIKDIGLEINDASGKFLGFGPLIEQLADKQLTLNEAATIFGTEAAPGMLAIVNQGPEAFFKMLKGITDTNKAMEVASKQTDGLTGDYKLWRSALEETALTFFDDVNPAMRSLVQSNTDLIEAMGFVLPGADAAGLAIQGFSSIVVGASKTVELLGLSLGGSAAALVQFVSGDFSEAAATIDRMLVDMDAVAMRGADLINNIWQANAAISEQTPDASGDETGEDNAGDSGLPRGRGDREAQQTERLREQLLEQVEILAEAQLTDEERLFEQYANEQFLLEDALELKAVSEQQYQELLLASTANFEAGKTAIIDKENKKQLSLEAKANKAHIKAEKVRNKHEAAGRAAVYQQGINLLRRFADDNKAITLFLIALQTAKTVKEIQTNAATSAVIVKTTAAAAAVQIKAYAQIEAAAIMASTLGTGTALAAAAIARGVTSAATVISESAAAIVTIKTQAVLASGLAIAGGVIDAIDATAGAPGSSTNPINTTSVDPVVSAADFTIASSTRTANFDDTAAVEPPPIFSPAQQQNVLAQPRVLDLTLRATDIFTVSQFTDGLSEILTEFLGDGQFELNVDVT